MRDVDRILARLAVRQHEVFSREQARERGLSRSALSRRIATGQIVARGRQSLHFPGVKLTYRGRLHAGLFDAWGTEDEATNALDSACRMRLTSVPEVRRRLAEMGRTGRPGVARFESAVRSAVVDSWLERRFIRLLRSAGLPIPAVQQRWRLAGVGVVRVDFEFPIWGVVIEVGGRLGYQSNPDRHHKERRRNALQIDGKTVYFFTHDDVVKDPAYVVGTVAAALGMTPPARRTG